MPTFIWVSLSKFFLCNSNIGMELESSLEICNIIVFVWSQYDGVNIEQYAMVGAKTKKSKYKNISMQF